MGRYISAVRLGNLNTGGTTEEATALTIKSEWEKLFKNMDGITLQNIKGKEYAEVNERIKAFRMLYPDGAIVTDIIDMHDGIVTMKATVMDADGRVLGTGTAQEKEGSTYINKTSYLENCVPIDTQIKMY